jgi:hypothetical protein
VTVYGIIDAALAHMIILARASRLAAVYSVHDDVGIPHVKEVL